ncbi:hypothetical protein [Horticoccus sp. 23ND18S-11]|uniref:hypothetical protein n=1 Tax=Horticoccus sp. 23ND18S-11 TaxID=3391832 RepID=UPI0039C91749
MKSVTRKLLGVATTLAALASAASLQAVVVNYTFNFSANGTLSNSKSFVSSPSGVGVTVTADSLNGNSWVGAQVGQYSGGLGVTNSQESGSGDSHTLDGSGNRDYLVFQFAPAVDVNSLTIGYEGYQDSNFYYWLNNTGTKPTDLNTGSFVNSTGTGSYNIAVGSTTEWTYLVIAAGPDYITGSGRNQDTNSSGLKISSLGVSRNVPNNTPGVPDGGRTVLFLGSAIAALGLVARRRKVA